MNGLNKEGLEDLDRLIGLRSTETIELGSWQSYYHRGRFLHRLIDANTPEHVSELAISQLIEAAKGNDAAVYEVLGKVLEQSDRLDLAVKIYTQALQSATVDTQFETKLRNLRGWAYSRIQQPGLAMADFHSSIDSNDAEAYSGLGFVLASLGKKVDAAESNAAQALLYSDGDYLILHNVACIYAKLAENVESRRKEFEDRALIQLRRAVDLWRRGGTTSHDELEEIRGDDALESLRHRLEFEKLIKQ